MSVHELKCWPSQFDAIERGDKTFEVRRNDDRDFAVGDVLVLRKWDPARRRVYAIGVGSYVDPSGRTVDYSSDADTMRVLVTYVLHGGRFALPAHLCVMSIVHTPGEKASKQ